MGPITLNLIYGSRIRKSRHNFETYAYMNRHKSQPVQAKNTKIRSMQ